MKRWIARLRRERIHLHLGLTKLGTVVCEGNFEELVLPDEYDVVVLRRVEFVRGVRWFGGVSRRMEPIQKLSSRAKARA